MYSIIYEQEAQADLLDIVYYYATQGGLTLANSINSRIQNHIKRLEVMPYRASISDTVPNAREFLIENLPYKAMLKIDDSQKVVYIFNIVHTSRNYP